MSRYREIKISNDHTKEEKEFFNTFPYYKPFTKYDYTFNQYQKEDQDWLTESACSPEYQHFSDTFQSIKKFIERNLLKVSKIVCFPRNTYRQTMIEVVVSGQLRLFETRAIVLQQIRDYLDNLPYFIPYIRIEKYDWNDEYKFHIDEYIIDQIRNNPNLDITINTEAIIIYITKQSRRLPNNRIPIHFGIYQKIESYLKNQPSKTHFCGITTEINFVDRQKDLIYQPYNPELTFEWEERYDQCQQTQTHLSETLHFGEKLKID